MNKNSVLVCVQKHVHALVGYKLLFLSLGSNVCLRELALRPQNSCVGDTFRLRFRRPRRRAKRLGPLGEHVCAMGPTAALSAKRLEEVNWLQTLGLCVRARGMEFKLLWCGARSVYAHAE